MKTTLLLDNDKPIQYREGENIDGIIAPGGYEVPLHLDNNGNVIIPTLAEIDEMIANDEGEYVGHLADANQPSPQLTEEEWLIQEAWRMIQEGARHQQ